VPNQCVMIEVMISLKSLFPLTKSYVKETSGIIPPLILDISCHEHTNESN